MLAKKLAKTHGEAAYQLALFYQAQSLIPQAITWYQQSIRLRFPSAYIALAQYYYQQDNFELASELLTKLALLNDKQALIAAQILEIKIAITQGSLGVVKNKLAEYRGLISADAKGNSLLTQINHYQVLAVENNITKLPACPQVCNYLLHDFHIYSTLKS